MEQCHSILRECLQILEVSSEKYPQPSFAVVVDNNNQQQPDIPSEQMKLSFSQFKSIVLNQGIVALSIIDRKKSQINKTSPHLLPLQVLSN